MGSRLFFPPAAFTAGALEKFSRNLPVFPLADSFFLPGTLRFLTADVHAEIMLNTQVHSCVEFIHMDTHGCDPHVRSPAAFPNCFKGNPAQNIDISRGPYLGRSFRVCRLSCHLHIQEIRIVQQFSCNIGVFLGYAGTASNCVCLCFSVESC